MLEKIVVGIYGKRYKPNCSLDSAGKSLCSLFWTAEVRSLQESEIILPIDGLNLNS